MIMETTGRLKDIKKNVITNKYEVTFEVDDNIENAQELADQNKLLRIKATAFRQSRSLNANALFWGLVGIIAEHQGVSKEHVYLDILKHYGKYTYVVVHEKAVSMLQQIWRLVEVVGTVDVNGQEGVQCICYYGSSTYDSKEMGRIIDAALFILDDAGLQNPYCSADMQRAIEEWGNKNG